MTASHVFLDSPESIQRHLRDDIERYEFDCPGVRFVLCDDRNEVRAHVHIADTPTEPDHDEYELVVSTMAESLAHTGDDPAMLLALMRPGTPSLTPSDGCGSGSPTMSAPTTGVRLLGVHVLTPHGQREINLDDAL